ncbi:MAG TPA: ABC transporter substrate-binding protein [Burkholderiales bacterium]|nr:ABC transporter substrate-binding protein [Burkholderiales bacterium]
MRLNAICKSGWLIGALLLWPAADALAQARALVLGQSAALTGSQAQFGKDIRDGALAAFEYVNQSGGIHGRRVELVTLDDAGSEAKAKENSQLLVADSKVLALFGYISRPSSVAGAKIASESKVPFIAPFSGTPALYRFDPYIFTIRASYDDELAGMVKQLVMTGYTRIGFAYLNDARQVNVPLVENLLAKHGLKPAVLVGLDRTSGEVTEQAKALASANPEVLLALANNVPLTALTREARKMGNTTPFWIVSFVDSKLMVKDLGPLAEGQVFAQIVPLPTKRNMRIVKEYQRDYAAKFPKSALSFTSLEGYIAARTLVEGLKRAGPNPTRSRLARALESLGDFDLGDYFINFSADNHNGSRFVDLTIVNKDGQFLN